MSRKCSIILSRFYLALLIVALGASPAAGEAFVFSVDPGQVVPPLASDHFGSCVAVMSFVEDDVDGEVEELPELVVSCVTSLDEITGARIRRGARGENGPVLFRFDEPDAGTLEQLFDLGERDLVDLFTDNLYLEISTENRPRDELRGQITGVRSGFDERALIVPLAGGHEVPPVSTAARGRCVVIFGDPDPDDPVEDFLVACTHDVARPSAAHVHRAAAGENGPPILTLGDGTSPFIYEAEDDPAPLPPDLFTALRAGELYVNIHSANHPTGEIRGQIAGCVAGPENLCLNQRRFEVRAQWADSSGNSGDGMATPLSADTGLFWFFSPDNVELMVKVLDACGDPFNHYWVLLSATTDVELTVTVTDTESGEVRTYFNPLGQPFETVLDTAAFATCP